MNRSFFLALTLALSVPVVRADSMVCPDPPAVQTGCSFHYHVAIANPATDAFEELYGVNSFATLEECATARAAELRRNVSDLNTLLTADSESHFQTNRFGPCHCDMTHTAGNPLFLSDVNAALQRQHYADLEGRLRLALAAAAVPHAPQPPPAASPAPPAKPEPKIEIHWSSDPQPAPAPPADATAAAIPAQAPPPPTEPKAVPSEGSPVAPPLAAPASGAPATPVPAIAPASPSPGEPTAAAPAEAAPTPSSESEDAAVDAWLNYEIARVQEVLKASSAVTDDSLKSSIFSAAMERLQLLSNLRAVVASPGAVKLRQAMAAVHGEPARLALAADLFGPAVAPHWAPGDARDAVVDIPAPIAAGPEAVLRDDAHATIDQRKLALYAFLARTPSLEASQEIWLAGVVDGFLGKK